MNFQPHYFILICFITSINLFFIHFIFLPTNSDYLILSHTATTFSQFFMISIQLILLFSYHYFVCFLWADLSQNRMFMWTITVILELSTHFTINTGLHQLSSLCWAAHLKLLWILLSLCRFWKQIESHMSQIF